MAVNKQLILGRIGKKEMRYTAASKAVLSFSVATTEKRNGEDDTTWFNCIAWEKTAENIEKFFEVGSEIYLEGRTQNRSYDDNSGNKKYISEVVVQTFSFTGGSKSASPSQGDWSQKPQRPEQGNNAPPFDPSEEIPF